MIDVQHVTPGMDPVIEAFGRMLADGREVGAELAVIRDGRPLLVARGGTRDQAGRPWGAGTLVQVFSTGKPAAAAAALAAVADGLLGLDDPIVRHWPDYVDDPARPTTLRGLLAHRAGKFAFPDSADGLDPLDREALIASLAAAAPEHLEEFGSVEHATTYGHLIDGVLDAVGAARIDRAGAALGELVGATFRFGVPTAELARVADLVVLDTAWIDSFLETDLARRALTHPHGVVDPALLNSDAWRQASFPAIGLHTDAISLARWYDDLAGLVRADRAGRAGRAERSADRTDHADGADRRADRADRNADRADRNADRADRADRSADRADRRADRADRNADRSADGADRSTHGALCARLGAELMREAVRGEGITRDGFSGEVNWGLGVRIDGAEIGMGGIGGSAAWYSVDHDYSMAYVTRGLGSHDRVDELADLVEAALP